MTDRGTDDVTPRVRVTRAFSQLHDPAPRDHVPPLFANMPAPRSRGATHASARPTSPTSLPPPQRRKPALASSTTPSSSLKGTADAQQSTLPSRAPTTSAERPNGAESVAAPIETKPRPALPRRDKEMDLLRLKQRPDVPHSLDRPAFHAVGRRARLNKSHSCATSLMHTGLTVAEAAAASHRTRTRRLLSSATDTSSRFRAGYWNGRKHGPSSLSCNNLADLAAPTRDHDREKHTLTSPSLVVAPSTLPCWPPTEATPEDADPPATMTSQPLPLQPRPRSTPKRETPAADVRVTSPRASCQAPMPHSYDDADAPFPAVHLNPRDSARDVRIWVGTWNMGAADPFEDGKGIIDEQRSAKMLTPFVPHGYHLYVVGIQEGVSENVYHAVEAYLNRNDQSRRYVRLHLMNGNFMVNHKNQPSDAVIDAVHGRGDGAFVGTKFTGMAVFYAAEMHDQLELIRAGAHKFKLTSGSKGGVAVALRIQHTTMVFVNCHLDARNDVYRREQIRNLNANLGRVMGHASFDLTEQFHHVVWMGDLNYRIVLLDPQMVLHMLEEGRNLELHDKFDGLLNDRRNGSVFEGFTEPTKFPDFYPTYKKFPNRGKVNQNLPLWPSLVWRVLYKEPFYKGGKVKKRVPGWCDRILIHSLLVSDSKLLPEKVPDPTSETASPRWIDNYRSVNEGDGMDVSDHSPVFGTFVLGFPRGETDALPSGTSRTLPHRKNRALSTLSNGRSDRYASCSVGGSYFDQARVVRQMKAHRRPVSTVLRVFNMTLSWHTHEVVPKKTRVVAPLVGEDAKQCDVIGERCHGANGLNLSLNAVMQHTRPLEQLHMLVWVKHETIHGHCTLSLKRIARQEEGNEVKFRVPLYHDSMRLHINGHPLVVVFSVRSKTFAK